MTRPTAEEEAFVVQLRLVWGRLDETYPPLQLVGDKGNGRFYQQYVQLITLADEDVRKDTFSRMEAFGITGADVHKVLRPVGGAWWMFRDAPRLEAFVSSDGFSIFVDEDEARVAAQAELDQLDKAERAFMARSTT